MSDLVLKNIRKHYGPVHVVKGIDLRVCEGEFAVLVGPSGCGKSTLLRSIAGLEEISEGEITLGERDMTNLAPRDRNLAMVFQSYALYPYLSVRENIAFGLKARKVPSDEVVRRVADAVGILGLEEYLDRKPRELSGGQRQRVAIGRAIVRDADIFLFDEPLSNLDAKLRDGMREELKKLHQRLGKTFIYVTHDQVEAMTLADNIILLNEGRIAQKGKPLDLFDKPDNMFVAGFLGSPSMNFLHVCYDSAKRAICLADGQEIVVGKESALKLGPTGNEVVWGIRPDHFSLAKGGQNTLGCEVDVVQPTGARKIVSVHISESRIVVDLPVSTDCVPGEVMTLQPDISRSHFFDGKTGELITRG